MVTPIILESATSQQTRFTVENQYGVLPSVPTWLRTSDIRIVPSPQFTTEAVIGAGDELPSGLLLNDEYTNLAIEGRAGYTTLLYVLSSLFGYPISAVVGGSTYDHTWSWNGRTPIIPATYGLHYGLPGAAKQILGAIFNTMNMTVNRGGYDFTTSAFGKATTETGISMGGVTNERQTLTVTGSPTALAPTLGFKGRTMALASAASFTAATIQALLESIPTIGLGQVVCGGGPWPGTPITVDFVRKLGGQNVPLLTTTGTTFTAGTAPALGAAETTPGADAATGLSNIPLGPLHFDIFAGDSLAEIQAESTKLIALYNLDMAWADRWARAMPVNSSRSSDGIYAAEGQSHTVGLRFGVDSVSEALYTNVRNSTKKWLRLKAVGPLTGDSTYHYELVIDLTLLVNTSDGYGSEGGIHIINWGTLVARDEVNDAALAIRLRNKRSTL